MLTASICQCFGTLFKPKLKSLLSHFPCFAVHVAIVQDSHESVKGVGVFRVEEPSLVEAAHGCSEVVAEVVLKSRISKAFASGGATTKFSCSAFDQGVISALEHRVRLPIHASVHRDETWILPLLLGDRVRARS